jgi:hypothetical protein
VRKEPLDGPTIDTTGLDTSLGATVERLKRSIRLCPLDAGNALRAQLPDAAGRFACKSIPIAAAIWVMFSAIAWSF